MEQGVSGHAREGITVTFWEFFGLVVGAAAVFALFLWLSSWLTGRVLDQRERERMRRRQEGR